MIIYEADRHAKKELKKHVRGLRKIENSIRDYDREIAAVLSKYCSAVRGSLTSDGRPPLDASGLKLQERLTLIEESLQKVDKKKDCRNHQSSSNRFSLRGLTKLQSYLVQLNRLTS